VNRLLIWIFACDALGTIERLKDGLPMKNANNMNIRRQLALGFAVLVGIVVLNCGLCLHNLAQSNARFTEYVKSSDESAKKAVSSADSAYDEQRITLVLVNLAALLVILAVGWRTASRLHSALGAEPAELGDVARRVAEGNLSEVSGAKTAAPGSVLASMGAMQHQLVDLISHVRHAADAIAAGSLQIARGNQDLSGRTEQQASALQQTAASMEELGSTVKQNAENARQANQLAQAASTVAIKGGEVVGQVVDTMKGINDSSKRIADITSVIDGIAFQTNILALNAAVEAARAGEQGRGFAVVAGEVRTLAQRSAEAAREIKSLITDSVARVGHGTNLVDQAGTTMSEVVDSIRRVTDIVSEISAASAEQSSGVQQVGEAVGQMDKTTQQNAALVEQSAAAAASLQEQAQDLVRAISAFKLARSDLPSLQSAPAAKPRAATIPAKAPAPSAPRPGAERPQADAGKKPAFVAARSKPAVAVEPPADLAKVGDDWTEF
jgi:methyl-accepting chemotaxis protein-1 (serine sensor receptor)